ncbi:MAG TPA: Cache 3/Cache 2 fusion domain-containing protein [Burkholderiales bacterium]|nr:Cache 3/Cache 2 fusion domain-containing protein [Burkholderiales bacterium]
MLKSFSKLSIGMRYALTASALVLVSFGALLLLMSLTMTRYLDQQTIADLTAANRQVQELVQIFDGALDKDVVRVAKQFASYFPEHIELERGKTVKIGDISTPVLRAGAEQINLNFDRVDAFTARTGVTATVFARSGRDFIRISTSLKKEDGSRAIGTQLDHEHPGYKVLLEGRAYRGPAVLFGRNYATSYEPIRDNDGQVIGVLYVGIDINQDLEVLKQKIRAAKLRQSGYFYVLDARPGAGYGTAVVHPKAEGSNLLGTKDAAGYEVVREMLEKKQGMLRYVQRSGDAEEIIAAYSFFPSWNWLIVGETPVKEAFEVSNILRGELFLGALIIALTLSLLLYVTLKRTIARRLSRAVAYARQVASGDLSTRIRSRHVDETGQLLNSLDDMADSLSNIVSGVRVAADSIHQTAKQLRAGNADLSQRTEEQASSLEETAASMEELTGTVKQNSENAREANELAQHASKVAMRGGELVGQVVTTMSEIQVSSKRIADIVAVIDSIAFQTNILALNAAVEAARAGEQGRGFAVVAGEVRSLAQRSADSAKEVKQLIYSSVERVDNGGKLVAQAGVTMDEIVTAVKHVSELMAGIAEASVQQSSGIQEINQTVSVMEQVTQQNAALVEEATASAEQLRRLAENLVTAVSVFKVPQGARPATPSIVESKDAAGRRSPRAVGASAPQGMIPRSGDGEWEEF